MVIIPDQEEPEEDDEPEPLIDVSEAPVSMASHPQVSFLIKICSSWLIVRARMYKTNVKFFICIIISREYAAQRIECLIFKTIQNCMFLTCNQKWGKVLHHYFKNMF